MKLNIGCGSEILDGFVNLDSVKLKGVDVVWDLNRQPYPFKDNTFEHIYCSNILEHLDSKVKPLEEIWRISKPKSKVEILVPLYPSYTCFHDPTHKQLFTLLTFEYFTPNHSFSYYSKARFNITKRKIIFWRYKKPFTWIVNLNKAFQNIYYNLFSNIILPNMLSIELEVVK